MCSKPYQMEIKHRKVDWKIILPPFPQAGISRLIPVGRRFLAGPLATCRVLEPKPRHCSVSVVYFCTGDTHSITSSFESPPIASCSMWVNLVFRYGMWLWLSDRACKTSARALKLKRKSQKYLIRKNCKNVLTILKI